jgi:hypothetical protein
MTAQHRVAERPSTIYEWRYLPRGVVAHAVGRYAGEIQVLHSRILSVVLSGLSLLLMWLLR